MIQPKAPNQFLLTLVTRHRNRRLTSSPLSSNLVPRGRIPFGQHQGCKNSGIVYKKDDKHAKENYRPIAVLSFVNKVFERLLGNQITTKYDDRLGDGLTAYRKHNSCETSVIGLVGDWKLARDNRLSVGILFNNYPVKSRGISPDT